MAHRACCLLQQISMSKRALPLLIVIAALAAGGGLWASHGLFGPGTAAAPLPEVTSVTLLPTPRVLPAF
jgi:hypothetical protein